MRLSSIAVGAVVMFALLTGCGGGKARRPALPVVSELPTLQVRGATLAGYDFQGATYNVAFDVTNPNPVVLALSRLSLVVEVEGTTPYSIEARPGVAVAGAARTPVIVPFHVRYADIPNVVSLLGTTERVALRASGSVGIETASGLLPMPLAFDAELPLPRLPTVAFEGISASGFSAAKKSFDVKLRIENPNPFPLPAGRLGYVLSLAGSAAASSENERIPGTRAGSSTTVAISAQVSVMSAGFGAGKAILTAASGGEVPVRIHGQASLAGIPVPFDLEKRIPKLR